MRKPSSYSKSTFSKDPFYQSKEWKMIKFYMLKQAQQFLLPICEALYQSNPSLYGKDYLELISQNYGPNRTVYANMQKPPCEKCLNDNKITVANTLDHIQPRAQGGADKPFNLRWLCKPCHDGRKKS